MFKSFSLRTKLSLSVSFLAVLILGLMTFFVAHESFKTARENAGSAEEIEAQSRVMKSVVEEMHENIQGHSVEDHPQPEVTPLPLRKAA